MDDYYRKSKAELKPKYVSREAFQALWTSYIERERYVDFHKLDQGIQNLWCYEDNRWWYLHPEEKKFK